MKTPVFHFGQAEELAQAFNKAGVEYLFLGKSAAIPNFNELPLLESFREKYEKKNSQPLKSAADLAAERNPKAGS